MGTTAGGLPYPEATDPINQGHVAMKALAEAVDATTVAGTWTVQAGLVQSGTTDANGDYVVTFPQTFAVAPVVVAVFYGVPSPPGRFLHVRTTTTTTFTARMYLGSTGNPLATTGINVSWIAHGTAP